MIRPNPFAFSGPIKTLLNIVAMLPTEKRGNPKFQMEMIRNQ